MMMHRFLLRPRWIALHAAVLAGIVLMASLGFWQLRRLDERREFNATVEARASAEIVDLDSGLADTIGDDPDANQWRPVRAVGTYVAGEAITIVNRSSGGVAGVNVVVPLLVADGTVILVNRGFAPLSVAPEPPPTGTVAVIGHLRRSESRRLGGAVDATGPDVTEFQRFDIAAITTSFGGDSFDVDRVASMYLQSVGEDPPPGGQWPAPVPLPILDEGPHLSYAVQWYIFGAFVAAGWVVVVRRAVNDRRRAGSSPVASSS
jgi:cytochrome oxidase assembly protein ShyY1